MQFLSCFFSSLMEISLVEILGDSTGLSSFMVIVAIMIGGGLFGVPGMIAGVPVFAVLYALIWRLINHSLNDKNAGRRGDIYKY